MSLWQSQCWQKRESFIKAAHDFMTVTYLYCFDLDCLNQKWLRYSHTHTHTHTHTYFLVKPADVTIKALSIFLFKLLFKNVKMTTSRFQVFLKRLLTSLTKVINQRQLKHELFELKLHPNTQIANSCFLFNKKKRRRGSPQTHYSSLYNIGPKQ